MTHPSVHSDSIGERQVVVRKFRKEQGQGTQNRSLDRFHNISPESEIGEEATFKQLLKLAGQNRFTNQPVEWTLQERK